MANDISQEDQNKKKIEAKTQLMEKLEEGEQSASEKGWVPADKVDKIFGL